MADEKKDAAEFRYWLVGKLASSRWPVRKDDTDETMSKRLGVRPEVLAEARAVLQKMKRPTDRLAPRLGIPKALDGKKRRFRVFVEPPPLIYADWHEYVKLRRLESAVLLRSALHHAMQLTWQPIDLHSGRRAWRYKGQSLAQDRIRDHDYRMSTEVNQALFDALTQRAIATGTTSGAIARWALVLLLEGWLEKTLLIVPTIEALYKSPSDYCLAPEKKRIKE